MDATQLFFSSYRLNYTQVCGQVRGYQYGTTDGIYPVWGPGSSEIDDVYVDGISITHRSSPCKHIWTYAAGFVENSLSSANCPCNNGSSQTTPSFVGEDYYCESGAVNAAHRALIHCGMASSVATLKLLVAPLLKCLGLLKPCLNQLLTTLNLGCVTVMDLFMRILQLTT